MAIINEIHTPSLMRTQTLRIKVTGQTEMRWRMKISAVLFRCAARVLGCHVEIVWLAPGEVEKCDAAH